MKSVAIVIPCRNEEKYIAGCLDSILRQTYSQDRLSVYVCDGKSTDATITIVNSYEKKHKNIQLLSNEKQSTPVALNLGIKKSDSDIVIILGAHSELYPDYVSNCVAAFDNDTTIGCTGGILENVYSDGKAEAIGKAMSSSFGVGNAHFRTGTTEGFVDTVAFGAYRREVFHAAGYFDEELIRNQDDEFNYRLTKAGYSIYLLKTIRSKYYVRASFEKLFKQYYQYGYWKVYVGKKHRKVTTVRQLIPLFFVLFLFLLPVFIFLHRIFLFFYLGILAVYLVTGFLLSVKMAGKINQVGKIMYSFLILHFSYGVGYLKGIIDFFILQKGIKKVEKLTR